MAQIFVKAALALLLIRLSLGYFLGVWGGNKLMASEQSVQLFQYFYGVATDRQVVSLLGLMQIGLAVAIVLGVWRKPVYLAGLAVHSITILVIGDSLLAPFTIEDGFPVNRGYAASVPVWAAFATLWLLRKLDWMSIDQRRTLRMFISIIDWRNPFRHLMTQSRWDRAT